MSIFGRNPGCGSAHLGNFLTSRTFLMWKVEKSENLKKNYLTNFRLKETLEDLINSKIFFLLIFNFTLVWAEVLFKFECIFIGKKSLNLKHFQIHRVSICCIFDNWILSFFCPEFATLYTYSELLKTGFRWICE